jgi:CDGSH-type Zn-finger protein
MEKKITIQKGGPYLVEGSIPLNEVYMIYDDSGYPVSWEDGKEYPIHEKYFLCRCGHSKNFPFCDGNHTKEEFIGREISSNEPFNEQAKLYQGTELNLKDVKKLCVLAQFCNREGGVWSLIKESEVPFLKEIAIEEANNCPAGRLVAIDNYTREDIEPFFEPSISLIVDPEDHSYGAIWVKGRIPIISSLGFTYEVRNRVTLCRCGKSGNKPFCDGSHLFIRF